jgi:hypothetical protein
MAAIEVRRIGRFRMPITKGERMKRCLWSIKAGASVIFFGLAMAHPAWAARLIDPNSLRTYTVEKLVRDFPDTNDLSTPESANATIDRAIARNDYATLARISEKKLRGRLAAEGTVRKPEPQDSIDRQLSARVVEVIIWRDQRAIVIEEVMAKSGKRKDYFTRSLIHEDGGWLNTGQAGADSVARCRQIAREAFAYYAARERFRPAPADPAAYLKGFTDYLKTHGQEPHAFVMKSLAEHQLTIIGEIHNRQVYWAFNSGLAANKDFGKSVKVVYMEFPMNDQPLIDKFLAEKTLNTAPVVQMLRDMFEQGWPDQPTVEFFEAVWKANQSLDDARKVRIVLVDMQRPWDKIESRADWRRFEPASRDKLMADNILADLKAHDADKRHSLFLVGGYHASLNLALDDSPVESAGWYLRKALGAGNVYSIMQHRPIMTNQGRIDGRVCMGLFESAFEQVGGKPVAFSLQEGPFGLEPYDADPERPVSSTFKDGYSAYLYLCPLDGEKMSPLVPGFYSEEFIKEMDRRCMLMYGQTAAKAWGLKSLTPETAAEFRSQWWGQPREDWNAATLGPLDAWKRGGDWKKNMKDDVLAEARKDPSVIRAAAEKLFAGLSQSPPVIGDYMVNHDYPAFEKWVADNLGPNPIAKVKLGDVSFGADGTPSVTYELTRKDGSLLKGTLPFYYDMTARSWSGMEGIDWHLRKPNVEQTGK